MSAASVNFTSRQMVLVFTDLVGSVALKSKVGNVAYAKVISRHDALFKEILASCRDAEVMKDTGDGFLARFSSCSSAVSASLRFQYSIQAEKWGEPPIRVRIGIHAGEVAELEKEATGLPKLVGWATDIAARVMALAMPGQILMTRAVFDDARMYVRDHPDVVNNDRSPPLEWRAHGPYLFKGADEPLEIYEVGAVNIAPLGEPPDNEHARRVVAAGDEIMLGVEGGWRPGKGQVIPGTEHWFLDEKLGEGGFGEVWRVSHRKTREQRVFKFCFQADRLRGLKREVVLFRLLKEALGDRDDIARIIDWHFEKPPFFIESEYTPAGSLPNWAGSLGGIDSVPAPTRLEIVAQIADALAASHSVGVLHKDIKPSNVLIRVDKDGSPHALLADFGIGLITDRAMLAQQGITATGLTQAVVSGNESSRTGTRLYMAPELHEGKPATTHTDIYALGVLLYQISIGDFSRALALGWERDIDDELLRDDIAKCVDGRPENRHRNATEISIRLRALDSRRAERAAEIAKRLQEQADEIAERRRIEAEQETRRRRRVALALAGFLLFATLIGVIGAYVQSQSAWKTAEEQKNNAIAALRERDDVEQKRLETQQQLDVQRQRAEKAEGIIARAKSSDPGTALSVAPSLLREIEKENTELADDAKERLRERFAKGWVGAKVCSRCHSEKPLLGKSDFAMNEYKVWREKDQHSKAFESLASPQAQHIAQTLNFRDPQSDSRCLSCHACDVPERYRGEVTQDQYTFRYSLNEGVTCELCHGPSKEWMVPHTSPEWAGLRSREKALHGMVELRDPVVRSKLCLSCHLGSATEGKVVTHEMYAAGHPPLQGFELVSLSHAMPPHWRVDRLQEVQYTAIGAVVTLRESMALLSARAYASIREDQWPDLTQFNCYGCHLDTKNPRPPSWRDSRDGGGPLFRFQSWPRATPFTLVHIDLDHRLRQELVSLDRLCQQRGGFGDPQSIALQARQIVHSLDSVIAQLHDKQFSQNDALKMIHDVCSVEIGRDYSTARQLARTIRSIYGGLQVKPEKHEEIEKIIHLDLSKALMLDDPRSTDDPKYFGPIRDDNSYEAFRRHVDRLRTLLARE